MASSPRKRLDSFWNITLGLPLRERCCVIIQNLATHLSRLAKWYKHWSHMRGLALVQYLISFEVTCYVFKYYASSCTMREMYRDKSKPSNTAPANWAIVQALISYEVTFYVLQYYAPSSSTRESSSMSENLPLSERCSVIIQKEGTQM